MQDALASQSNEYNAARGPKRTASGPLFSTDLLLKQRRRSNRLRLRLPLAQIFVALRASLKGDYRLGGEIHPVSFSIRQSFPSLEKAPSATG